MHPTLDGARIWQVTFRAHWALQEQSLHINVLELRAIHLALRLFLPHIKDSMVQVATDNMAAIYYVNKQGAHSFQLCAKIVRLCDWCILCYIYPAALHLAGEASVLVDHLSRHSSQIHKWSLKD